jgi:hypothetical protein
MFLASAAQAEAGSGAGKTSEEAMRELACPVGARESVCVRARARMYAC